MYTRNCPKCGKEIVYKSKWNRDKAERHSKLCHTCANIRLSIEVPDNLSRPCKTCEDILTYPNRNKYIASLKGNGNCYSCSMSLRHGGMKFKDINYCSHCEIVLNELTWQACRQTRKNKSTPEYTCKFCIRKRNKKNRQRIKEETFIKLGNGVIKCELCDETRLGALSVDHINGGGNAHRKEIKGRGTGHSIYMWLKRNNYPDGFRILCGACQWIERDRLEDLRQMKEELIIRGQIHRH
jgi:hypothetical protein